MEKPVIFRQELISFILTFLLVSLKSLVNEISQMIQVFKKILGLTSLQTAWKQIRSLSNFFRRYASLVLFIRQYLYNTPILIGKGFCTIMILLFYIAMNTKLFCFFCLVLCVLSYDYKYLKCRKKKENSLYISEKFTKI